MGKVRPEHVKKAARELIRLYPDKFTAEFESNRKAVQDLAQVSSRKLRNRIAGYITRLVSIAHAGNTEDEEENSAEEKE